MVKDLPVGIFDSGLGGLTSAKRFMELMPDENIVFLGDNARSPYGTKTKETISQYTHDDVDFLQRRGVKIVIAACNTVSSNVPAASLSNLNVPFVDTITPTVSAAIKATKTKRIGIIGTPATIKTGGFANRLKQADRDIETISNGCPMIVTLVENGEISEDSFVLNNVLREYLAPIKAFGVDTLILGCTHFPIVYKSIQKIMGDDVTLIDSGKETAYAAKRLLEELNLTRDGGRDKMEFYVTGSTDKFDEVANIFLEGARNVHSIKADIKD